MQAIKFKNFSNEDFSWSWNNMPYVFKAGESIFLEDFKATHFAKHLIDRELNKLGFQTNDMAKRSELISQCFPPEEAISTLEALQINEEEKIVKKKAIKGKKKVEEEEFEGGE
jgi:hypothetical protein